MLQSLKAEFVLLRQQNEDQKRQLRQQNVDLQHQLKHLQRDMRVALFLQRSNDALQTSPKTQLTRFNELPLEIREVIWELAVPSRLLRFKASSRMPQALVSRALSVPAVAHVCRESRHIFLRRQHVTDPSGRSTHLGGPSQLWQLRQEDGTGVFWTWFTPYQDALLVNPEFFMDRPNEYNYPIIRVAEHIVIEDCGMWERFLNTGRHMDEMSSRHPLWVRCLIPTGSSPYNLRTVDFAMSRVTKIDRTYPPGLVHRLFDGDYVKIVDLRDKEAVRGIKQILVDELPHFMKPGNTDLPKDLKRSLKIFRDVRATLFEDVRTSLLEDLAILFHQACLLNRQKSRGLLPMEAEEDTDSDMSSVSDTGSELDMVPEQDMVPEEDMGPEQDMVPEQGTATERYRKALNVWVEKLTERLDIRAVHVFIRVDEMPTIAGDVEWS